MEIAEEIVAVGRRILCILGFARWKCDNGGREKGKDSLYMGGKV